MSYASRVTIDIDGYVDSFEMVAVRAYHNLDRIADEVEVRVSQSGEGIHLVGWFAERLDDDQKFTIRRNLGDDANRIKLDEMRGAVGHTTNVLWDDDGDFSDIYDALDHIGKTTTDPQQVVKPRVGRSW